MGEPGDAARLKIFISYSRKDCAAFAQDLLTGLELLGFDPFLDKHDIAAGEDWEARLAGLIQTADTVVYVISPESVRSPRCQWEVDKANALSKRIIPVVALPVSEAETPQALKKLHYVFFDEPYTFARALSQLSQALKADLGWIREHTRLGDLATRWQERGRLDALLLRGPELEAAVAWMAGWKPGAPEITDTIRAFVTGSSDAEAARFNKERQQLEEMRQAQAARGVALAAQEEATRKLSRRTTIGIIGAGALSVAGAGLAWWGNDAERRFRDAQANSAQAAMCREAMREDLSGQLTIYASSPGQTAMEGPKDAKNSPFTELYAKALQEADQSMQSALAGTTQKVQDFVLAMHGVKKFQQTPYYSTDMNGELFLHRQPLSRRRKGIIVSVDLTGNNRKIPKAAADAELWRDVLRSRGNFSDIVSLTNPGKWSFESAVDDIDFESSGSAQPGNSPAQISADAGTCASAPLGAASLTSRDSPPTSNSLVFFYFAGLGVTYKNITYLMANDAMIDMNHLDRLPLSMVSLANIQKTLRQKSAASILVIDAHIEDLDSLIEKRQARR